MYKNNSGISLIELMVVLAIIGIIGMFAMPAYSKYVLRSKAAELLTIAQSCKIEIIESEVTNGSEDIEKNMQVSSKNIESVLIRASGDADNNRRYEVNVQSNISSPAGNLSLQLIGTSNNGLLSWECQVPSTMKEYMPSSCKNII